MSDRKIIVLRPNLPLRSAQPPTRRVIKQRRTLRRLAEHYRKLRNTRNGGAA
jgi:hypothetical protein